MELLATKLALFPFNKGKRVRAIHFQKDNKAVVSYPLKKEWEGGGEKERKYYQIKQIDLALSF